MATFEEIEKMRKFVEEHKAEYGEFTPRIPTTEAHQATLARITETVRPILIRYAKLVHDSGQVPDIETAKLEAYAEELEPIKRADDWNISGQANLLQGALRAVIRRDKYDSPQLTRRLFMILDYLKGGAGNVR